MAGHEGNLTGPDLAAGVAADDVKAGAPLLGHANGEAVLLARVGNEYFAIGATCTHYGGPLAEGVIDRRHRALPLAPRLLQPAHRRGTARARALTRRVLSRRAPRRSSRRRGQGGARSARADLSGRESAHASRRATSSSSARARQARRPPRCCAAAVTRARITHRRTRTSTRRTIGRTSPRTISRATRREEWIPLRPDDFYAAARHRPSCARRATRLDAASKRLEVEGREPLSIRRAAPRHRRRADSPRAPWRGGSAHVHYLRSLADSRLHHRRGEGREARRRDRRELHRARDRRVAARARARGPRRRAGVTAARARARHAARHVHQVAARGEGRRLPSRPQAGAHRARRRRARRRHVAGGRPRRHRRRRAAAARARRAGGARDGPRRVGERAPRDERARTSTPRATSRAGPTRTRGEKIRVEHWVVAAAHGADGGAQHPRRARAVRSACPSSGARTTT